MRDLSNSTLDMLIELGTPCIVILHGININLIYRRYLEKNIQFFYCSRTEYPNLAAALNLGLQKAEKLGFQYVRRIDVGDVVCPINFELNKKHVLAKNKNFYIFSDKKLDNSAVKTFMFDNPFIHSTLYIKLHIGAKYDEMLDYSQDFGLYIRYWREFSKVPLLDIEKNFSPTGASKTKRDLQLKFSIYAIQKSLMPLQYKLLLIAFRKLKILLHKIL